MFGWFRKKRVADPSGKLCMATHGVMREGRFLGVMVREAPRAPEDSGWMFEGAGEEGVEDPARWAIYPLKAIIGIEPRVAEYWDKPVGTVVLLDCDGEFKMLNPDAAEAFRR